MITTCTKLPIAIITDKILDSQNKR